MFPYDYILTIVVSISASKLVDKYKKLTAIGRGSKIPTPSWHIYNHRFMAAKEVVDNTKGTAVEANSGAIGEGNQQISPIRC